MQWNVQRLTFTGKLHRYSLPAPQTDLAVVFLICVLFSAPPGIALPKVASKKTKKKKGAKGKKKKSAR